MNKPRYTIVDKIEAAKQLQGRPTTFEYTNRDSILYNLSIGATTREPYFVYEGNEHFQVLPTFGAIPAAVADVPYDLGQIFTAYDPHKLLAGENSLEILRHPVPTQGRLVAQTRLLEILDKGKDAVVTRAATVRDEVTRSVLFRSENTSFVRGCGGYGGPRKSERQSPSVPIPSRKPDHVAEARTSNEQAVLYRLFGDVSPIHVDPRAAAEAGYDTPILHGMSTFGVAGMHILAKCGHYRSIRARFAGPALPGQTLVTEMWRDGLQVVFQVRVKETGRLCVSMGWLCFRKNRIREESVMNRSSRDGVQGGLGP